MLKSKQIQRLRKVLVVDDQEINRDVLGMILEEQYEVIYACNGKEAVEQIKNNISNLSIIMLDLIMPEMDGFQVLDVINSDEQMKKIPVIVLTSEKSAELLALQKGAADFITKPFDMHEVILARVSRIIELCEGRELILSAERDKISNLYSQNFFYVYAQRLYTLHKNLNLDAVVLNIEQFHSLNATNGREFCDGILAFVGNEINSFLQESEGIASRSDADRFDIYCVHQPDYKQLLERFQSALNKQYPRINIHLRMGVNMAQEGVEPFQQFDRARTACNMVRGDYQRPLMIYNEDILAKELLHHRLINDLNTAIKENQFKVYYQPKYNIQCVPPRLSSAEALIRWKHPQLGMISPGEFIPLFEGNGLISLVDNIVWAQTGKQIAEWKKKYNFTLPVSVNVSRADLFSNDLVSVFKKIVEDNELDYSDIKIEVTESAYTQNSKQLTDLISTLRSIGFAIEMDDFGSGYSSLNMLSSMPIDVLKMDMKFIRNIENSDTDKKLVSLILDIAKYLNLLVVAEGVETTGQLDILKEGKCDLVQGYYFSKPLPAEEFEQLIEKELSIKRD